MQLPVGGGAFAYVALTFGEFPAYITAAMLLMEYVLSGAAVARSFTSYLAALCNQDSGKFLIHTPHYDLDFIAVGIILLLSVLLCWSTKESSSFNLAVTAVHLTIMIFIIIAGFAKGDGSNLKPFAPFGVRGVFNAATQVGVTSLLSRSGRCILAFKKCAFSPSSHFSRRSTAPFKDVLPSVVGFVFALVDSHGVNLTGFESVGEPKMLFQKSFTKDSARWRSQKFASQCKRASKKIQSPAFFSYTL